MLSVLGTETLDPDASSSIASSNSEVVAWDGSLGESSRRPLYTTSESEFNR